MHWHRSAFVADFWMGAILALPAAIMLPCGLYCVLGNETSDTWRQLWLMEIDFVVLAATG